MIKDRDKPIPDMWTMTYGEGASDINTNDSERLVNQFTIVSIARDSDRYLQMVVNAFIRRCVSVYKTKGNILLYHRRVPNRSS